MRPAKESVCADARKMPLQTGTTGVPGSCFDRVGAVSAPHGPLISSERVAEVRLTRLSFTTGRKEPRAACRVVVVDETDSLR